MKAVFKFNANYLNRNIWILVIIGLIISLLFFLWVNIDVSYRYFWSMLLVFIGILIVFYLNRNELEQLNIKDEKIELFFFNKTFFKRKMLIYVKQELSIELKNNTIKLSKDNRITGKIRKDSTNENDWNEIVSYFIGSSTFY